MIDKKIYVNGKVYTADSSKPWAEAFCVENGKFLKVGTTEEIYTAYGNEACCVDLEGKTVLPGFIDSHAHVMQGAQEMLFKVNLAEATSGKECLSAVKEFYDAHSDTDFLAGVGWINTYFDSLGPRKEWLDDIAPNIPVVLDSGDHHSIWANSKAIELAGVTKDTVIEGGVLEKDPETGELSGTFRENAQAPFHAIKPVYSVDECKEAICFLEKLMGSLGITMVHDPMVELGSNELEAYRQMDAENRLNIKIGGSLMSRPESIEGCRDEYIKEREKSNNGGHFEVKSIKVLLDGVVEGATAYMKESYAHRPDYYGEPIWTDEQLRKHFAWAEANGFQTHSHVIGDAACAQMLDALEYSEKQNNKPNIRPVGAHMQIVDKADYSRIRSRELIVSANPYWHGKEKGYFYGLEVPYLGEERAEHEYPMKSLAEEANARIASGSDFPVTFPPAPLMGIQMGVTRCDFREDVNDAANILGAEERMSIAEMIDSFTINAAYADFAEEITGSVTEGKCADFIILKQDIFDVPEDSIHMIPILMTVSEGKVIYESKGMECLHSGEKEVLL